MKYLKILAEFFLLAFIFFLPWQIKLILIPSENNFNEISLYLSHIFLLASFIFFFVIQLIRKKEHQASPKIWNFLAALVVFMLISVFAASNKLIFAYHFVILLAGVALFYLLREGLKAASYQGSFFSRARAIYVFLASMFLQASLGIYQFLSQHTFANKYLGLAEHSPQAEGTSVIETISGRWLRAYGGMDHPNILGGVLVFALLLTAFLLAKKKIINSKVQAYGLLLLFVNYFVSLTAFFFTFSRSAWLAFLAGIVLLGINVYKKEDKWVKGRFLMLMIFSLVFFFLAVLPYKEIVLTRLKVNSRLEQVSLNQRSSQLFEAGKLITKKPLFGIGAGNYVSLKQSLVNKNEADYVAPVHNTYVLIWAETGLFALASFLFFLLFLARHSRRQRFSLALIASLLVLMMFDHWFFSMPFGILFLFFILGLI